MLPGQLCPQERQNCTKDFSEANYLKKNRTRCRTSEKLPIVRMEFSMNLFGFMSVLRIRAPRGARRGNCRSARPVIEAAAGRPSGRRPFITMGVQRHQPPLFTLTLRGFAPLPGRPGCDSAVVPVKKMREVSVQEIAGYPMRPRTDRGRAGTRAGGVMPMPGDFLPGPVHFFSHFTSSVTTERVLPRRISSRIRSSFFRTSSARRAIS